MSEYISQTVNDLRNEMTNLRSKFHDFQYSKKPFSDRVECIQGLLTCGISTLYSVIKEIKEYEIKSDDEKFGESLFFHSRGTGLDVVPKCFCCGATQRTPESNHYLNNISGIIQSKEDGRKLEEWFNGSARLDYREHSPDYIQFKIGSCDKCFPALEWLHNKTSTHGRIRQVDIEESKKQMK